MSRPVPLRQAVTQAQKDVRALVSQLQGFLATRAPECREMSRPLRKRSSYPTRVALRNGLARFVAAGGDIERLAAQLVGRLEQIHDLAARHNGARPTRRAG